MSAIEAMSSGIGAAVATAPSIGAEIGHAVSSGSKIGVSGGSFSPSLNSGNLFSETTHFAGSLASVREGPIGNPRSIFADSMRSLGLEPYIASPVTVAEKSISLDKGEWITLARTPAKTIAETVFPEVKPLMPENVVFSKTVADSDLTILAESVYKQTPREESVIEKSLTAEKEQAKKVEDLLAAVGLYTRVEARKRVAKIAEEKALARNITETRPKVKIKSPAMGRIEVEEEIWTEEEVAAEAKTESMVKGDVQTKRIMSEITQVGVEQEKNDKEISREKPAKTVPVIDEKAQASRKKEVKDKISGLFRQARRFGWEKINSGEITKDLEKNRQNRSLLLSQLWYPFLPDGSLNEIVKTVEAVGEIRDVSEIAEQDVDKWTEAVLDKNIAVKLADGKPPQVSDKDVKRVLKYLQPESLVG
jgi:hypothetical protein